MRPPDPAAAATATVMSEACATFEAVLEVLHARSRQAGQLTATYVTAAAAAADGRDAVITAPSASLLAPGPLPQLPLPAGGTDAAIADALAMIAGTLAGQLAKAAAAAPGLRDREALHAASLAAAAVRDCLLGTG